MIICLARTFKASAFAALLAYVLLLNVLLGGFAQAAMAVHVLNGSNIICTETSPAGTIDSAPGEAMMRYCQMCCLAVQSDSNLPPVVTTLYLRLGVTSAMLYPLEIGGIVFDRTVFVGARGPPLS